MPARPTEVLASWLRRAGATLLFGLLAVAPIRAQATQPVATYTDSDIKIQVADVYSVVPLRGFVPLRVTITNSSNSDGVWEIQTKAAGYGDNQSYDAQATCPVPARQTHVFEVLSPLPTFFSNVRMDQAHVDVHVTGPGVAPRSDLHFTPNLTTVPQDSLNITLPIAASTTATGTPPPPPPPPPGVLPKGSRRGGAPVGPPKVYRQQGQAIFVGLSPALNQNKGASIKTYFNSLCARPLQQTSLDPDQLSSDWRAYLGFDLLFYTAADWLDAPPGVRLAITQWVAAGGELRLVANSDGGLDLPPRDGEHYGAGLIELFTPDELANYDFNAEHLDPAERFLFSLAYQPTPPTAPGAPSAAIPAGMQKRQFLVGNNTVAQLIKFDPVTIISGNQSANYVVADQLANPFRNAKVEFPPAARVDFEDSFDPTTPSKMIVTNTPANLDAIAAILKGDGEPDGVVVGVGPALPVPPAGNVDVAAKIPNFADAAPVLVTHYLLVALTIVLFGILVGPVNLFVFCNGPRRPNLLWVTPLLAFGSGLVILVFILLAEGIGGHGLTFRITQLVPDGKFAVESEVDASVSGVLFQHDFELPNPAWILEYHAENPLQVGDWGDFWQSGPRYSGEWFASRRAQALVAQTVAPSRAALHVAPAADGQAPVLTSEYNDWMEKLFYLDDQGRYWKVDRISDGQPTPLQPATAEEFDAAWDAIMSSAPAAFIDDGALRKLTPRPGTFFALGNGGNPALEPALSGLHWSNFRHIITGPVLP
jgi:hypothetical protein